MTPPALFWAKAIVGPAAITEVIITILSNAEAQDYIKVSGAIDDEWRADMTKRGFDGKKLFQTAKDLIAKHSKG